MNHKELMQILARKKQQAANQAPVPIPVIKVEPVKQEQELIKPADTPLFPQKPAIILNKKQQEASDKIVAGDDICLIGAAGTGKTTLMRETSQRLVDDPDFPKIEVGTKHLKEGNPGIAIVSYTRKAVNNIRHAVVQDLKSHTITLHKLLEFGPEFFEVTDPTTGDTKKSMRFVPNRNKFNPLPSSLKLIIFEESSMISTELYMQLQEAMPHEHQEVFIGDIQQLPPIFGMAILGFKLTSLPVVELTEIYRQAQDSPIIDLAWQILKGDKKKFNPDVKRTTDENGRTRISVPSLDQFTRTAYHEGSKDHLGTVRIQIWQKRLSEDLALLTTIKQFTAWEQDGYYDHKNDIILCPFNKSFGTIELNKGISQYLGKKRNATVYEIIAGFNTHYLAVGDRVLYDKEDAVITTIRTNGTYMGKRPQSASVNLDRNGHYSEDLTEVEKAKIREADASGDDFNLEAIEAFMEGSLDEVQERVQAASHVIGIKFTHPDSDDEEIWLESAAEINNLLGGYAITIHKFQGSQAKKVFVILHQKHAVMMSRELLYTAVTRAESYLHVICETDSFYKAISSQRIKGNTIEEKAEYFKGKGQC
jgi:GTPase SAR1 family protein